MEDQKAESSKATTDQTKPEGLLYHYTDQNGLLGILGSRSIWATHVRFLNDASEFTHGLRIVRKCVTELSIDAGQAFRPPELTDGPPIQIESHIQGMLNLALDALDDARVFVSSFFDSDEDSAGNCEADPGDTLEQWRAYSKASAGFSIGFGKNTMLRHIDGLRARGDSPIIGMSCVYDEPVQQQVLKKIADEIGPAIVSILKTRMNSFWTEEFPKVLERVKLALDSTTPDDAMRNAIEEARAFLTDALDDGNAELTNTMISFVGKLIVPAVFMKHPAFRHEREWRIVKLVSPPSSDLRFRCGRSSLVPFVEIPLPVSENDRTLGIHRIVIGPSPNMSESLLALRMLLESKGIPLRKEGGEDGVEIVASRIPYRSG